MFTHVQRIDWSSRSVDTKKVMMSDKFTRSFTKAKNLSVWII